MSSNADVQHAVHEAGRSEEYFQCPFLFSPNEFGKTTFGHRKQRGCLVIKKKKGKCSEARKSACLQRHFHPDGISPQEGGSKEELGFGFCLCFRQMRHSLIFNIFLPKCVVLFLLISHILLGRSFYVTMLSFCSLADARAGWTCCEMWLSSRGAVLWVGEC